MSEPEFYTVNVYQMPGEKKEEQSSNHDEDIKDKMQFMDKFPNMISAKVIQGKVLELEHSKLAGPTVKLKTVINYEKTLGPGCSLGILLSGQDSYIAPE